jgi:hypothetical protein
MNTLPKSVVGFGAGQEWAILGDPAQNVAAEQESNYGTLTKGVVGFGAGQDWAILGDPGNAERTEVGYLSKGLVGFGAGQDWALIYKGNPEQIAAEEANYSFGQKKGGIFRRSFCRKYVKSLGYLRSEKKGGDKAAFIQAMNECLVNFKQIKKGRYKIKPADNMGSMTDVAALLNDAERETGVSKNDPSTDMVTAPTQQEAMAEANAARQAEKEGTGMNKTWIIVAVVAVVVIVAVVIYLRRRKG